MKKIFNERKKITEYYNENLDFTILKKLKIRDNTDWNFSYYPVIFESELTLLKVLDRLKEKEIFPRRYFYPSLNT
ncbi:DegT/DnrJ/EryC1/StrS family aminotransferase, partial [Salmonella enterica subsp. enterica serovar Enteritidis]